MFLVIMKAIDDDAAYYMPYSSKVLKLIGKWRMEANCQCTVSMCFLKPTRDILYLRTRRVKLLVSMSKDECRAFKSYLFVCVSVNNAVRLARTKYDLACPLLIGL